MESRNQEGFAELKVGVLICLVRNFAWFFLLYFVFIVFVIFVSIWAHEEIY